MKKYLLFLFLIFSTPAWATVVLETSTGAKSTDSFKVTTGTIDSSSCNLIVITSVQDSSGAIVNPTDNKGNTYTALTPVLNGYVTRETMYYKYNPTVGSGHTFTVDGGASVIYPALQVQCFSGAPSSPFEVEAGNASGSTTNLVGSVAPLNAGDVMVTGCSWYNDTTAATIDSGFTISGQNLSVSGQAYSAGMAYLVTTDAGSKNPTWTNNPSNASACSIAVFRALKTGIYVVNAGKKYAGSGTSTTLAYTATTGDLLYVSIGTGNSSAVTSITDTASNTYTLINRGTAGNFADVDTYYAKNITGGSLTITFNSNTSDNFNINVLEFAGIDTTSPLGGIANGNNTSSGSNQDIVSGSLNATAASGDLVVAAVAEYYYPVTFSVGGTNPSGMLVEGVTNNQIGQGVGNTVMTYGVLSGSYSGALSIHLTGTTYGSIAAASFKAAAGGAVDNSAIIRNATIYNATIR